MTDNHDYNTPSEGATDWHIPLNNNFRMIDRDVEVRDTEADLDQYRPRENAKFLANDTGRIYIGDGERWQHLGSVTAGRSMFRWGTPNDLQTKLDGARSQGGVIACVPGEVFENGPYTIPTGTTLVCNGAVFRATSDTDLLVPETGSRIVGPAWFDSASPDYSSSHINIDPGAQPDGSFFGMRGGRGLIISGVFRHTGTRGHGNAIRVKGTVDSDSGTNHNVTQTYMGHHMVRSIGNVILADAEGGFLNDNHIWIEADNCTNFWHHIGKKEAKFLIHGHLQTGNMDRGFYNETGRKSCRFWGHLEDPHRTKVVNVKGDGMKLYPTTRANFSQQPWDLGSGTTINGVGYERAEQAEPPAEDRYHPGEMVIFEDTGSGDGSGLYMKSPWEEVTPWIEISSGSYM